MFNINELDGEQRRQLIDTRQLFETFEAKRRLRDTRFAGSMRWGERSGSVYLLRKRGKSETSLGSRNVSTEAIYRQFMDGRERIDHELAQLNNRLARMAAVNAALGLGRVPRITARLLRALADAGLMGSHLHVVGTNALFAYEAKAGLRLESGLLATGDADLLLDARRRLRLALDDVRAEGVLGVIRKVDKSFEPRSPLDFRAINANGFYIDLVRPETRRVMSSRERDRIGQSVDDLHGSPIAGLDWLVNAPKFEAMALDDEGFPVRVHTVDPRAFALHKAWVAQRPDRDPIKRQRDQQQSVTVAILADRYLNLPFENEALTALPLELRQLAPVLLERARQSNASPSDSTASWW